VPGWQRQIKDYLTFSRKEQRGIFALVLLLVLLLLINLLLPFIFQSKPTDFSEFEKQIAQFEREQEESVASTSRQVRRDDNAIEETSAKLTPFIFDPNELTIDQGLKLGLYEKQVKVILNYLQKGGKFRKKEDFAKMYTISEQEYRILEPYIFIKTASSDKINEEAIKQEIKPFPFDPNTITEDQAMKMGLHSSVIKAIIGFRQKGGHFKFPTDLKKIYTLNDEEFAILEPYVQIAQDTSISLPTKMKVVIELNSSDSLDLQQLQGIGPSFARRIIKYRELLGGYSQPEQLMEVYGMDSIRYHNLARQLTVDKEKIRKININKVSLKEMTKHPYIEFYVAKSIINYRIENGDFASVNQILDAKLIYQELFLKIEPYLTVK
jgi:DNA uptake protein ComE-like DNA-binding protein